MRTDVKYVLTKLPAANPNNFAEQWQVALLSLVGAVHKNSPWGLVFQVGW